MTYTIQWIRQSVMQSIRKVLIFVILSATVCVANAEKNILEEQGLTKVDKTWGKVLNPKGEIPKTGFKAFYINSQQPNHVIFSEIVSTIAINYAYKNFHNIDSYDFGAYWIGTFTVAKDGLYKVNVNESWSITRVLLDKYEVYKTNLQKRPVRLSKGTYTLEVEYLNNWHTTELLVSVQPMVRVVQLEEIKSHLQSLNLPKETVVYAVGVYESKAKDNRIIVQVEDKSKPYALLLSSYSGITWDVKGNNPELIIYNSSNKGSTIIADKGVKTLASTVRISDGVGDKGDAKCTCDHVTGLRCSVGYDLEKLANSIAENIGLPLAGVNGRYAADVLLIPDIVINEQTLAKNKKRREDVKKMRANCTKLRTQTIENLMTQ